MNYFTEIFIDAMVNNRIRVLYQPIYDSKSFNIVAAEALCRIETREGAVLNPDLFIPNLEESCAITDLDWYVADKACATLQEISGIRGTDIRISLNFSQKHAYEWDSVERLADLSDKYGLIRDLLEVEFTETYGADIPLLSSTMESIMDEGFSVAVDDFGKGANSLSFIEKVPFNTLKIDRSLLGSNDGDEKSGIVVENIIKMAHDLDAFTVVEGVEDVKQLVRLVGCGCDMLQGHYLSRPLTKGELIRILSENCEAIA